ncbi:MAG: antitermination protein NusG [Proteobacteria bacterium]|nr:antitermination protein NusG [Pseudomonadota bacterium]
MLFLEFLARWGHVLFGVTWIGLLYYFNFIQGAYFAEATADAKADATQKLAPRALWWFRWGAMGTFLTGLYLLMVLGAGLSQYILIGATMGIFMFLNVWLIIWPNQQIVIGLKQGDAATAGGKALLASRTNTLFSAPMLYGMLASRHGVQIQSYDFSDLGFMLALAIIVLLEINAIFGKTGPIASVKGVIQSSLLLTAVIFGVAHYL